MLSALAEVEGAVDEAGGCSEGEEAESLSFFARHVISVSGQGHARGKQSCLALFPEPRLSTFIHGLILRAFSSSIVTQGLSKGFMPLTCAKHLW